MINVKICDDVAYIVLYYVSATMNGFILYDLVYIYLLALKVGWLVILFFYLWSHKNYPDNF